MEVRQSVEFSKVSTILRLTAYDLHDLHVVWCHCLHGDGE